MQGPITDLNNLTTAQSLILPTVATAAGAGDNTKITGLTIDRGVNLPKTAKVCIVSRSTLAAAATLSLAAEIQESADGSSWDTAVGLVIGAGTAGALTVVQAGGAGGTFHTVTELGLNLLNRKRYFRINVTPDLSAGATDTASVSGVAVLAGHDVIPNSAA